MNKQTNEIITSWLQGFQSNYALFSQPIITDISLYTELLNNEYSNLTFIIHPNSTECNNIYSIFANSQIADRVCNLGEHLFPTQSRQLINQLANGEFNICLITPEVFVYWFKQIINESVSNLEEDRVLALQNILRRLTHIIYGDIAMALPANTVYKEKYRTVLELSKRLPVKNLFLGSQSSDNLENLLNNYFEEVQFEHLPLSYNHVALHVQYEFSRQKQLNKLVNLLENNNQATIVYIQESSQDSLHGISQYLEDKNINHQCYTDNLSTELKTETLEYYLTDNSPNLIVNNNPKLIPQHTHNLSRIIYYSAPNNLLDVYYTISHFEEYLKDIHFIVSEDNLVEVHAKAIQQKKLINNREKIKVNYINQRKEFIQFFTERKLCLWKTLEQLLINKQSSTECNICDTCTHVKRSIWAKLSMSLLRLRKRIKQIA